MRKIATIIASLAVVGIDNAYAQSDSISLREVEVTAIAQKSSFKASTPVQQLSAERMLSLIHI